MYMRYFVAHICKLPVIIEPPQERRMNKLLTILFLINVVTACKQTIVATASKQTITDKQKIADFKNDFMDKVEMYKPDTLRSDTLTFVREKYPNVRLVKTFTKNRNVVIYDYYYNGTTQLQSTLTYDTLGKPTGVAKQYTKKGVLEYTQDYDKGEWIVFNKKEFPSYELQKKMKIMADSLVSKMYGRDFLINNTIWSVGSSAIYNENESGNWTDKFEEKPTKFLFRYNVKLDKDNMYDDLIEFELDANGNFIPNQYEAIFGFENVPENLKGGFKLTCEEAIKQAKQLGLTENNNTKAVGILRWENFKKPELINGHFRFYVASRTQIIENIVPNGRSSRITKYEVYSFNPWTGDFIEKKNMKSDSSWEKNSGSSTGLMPDNE
jgi:hypothetical protein